MLVFVEGGKPEYQEKNPRSRDENQQQTQPTYDIKSVNRTRARWVGGECSHHCAILAPPVYCGLHFVSFCFLFCLKGLKFLLDNRLSHPLLKTLLGNLQDLVHDSAEKVRVAFLDVLVLVKGLKAIKVGMSTWFSAAKIGGP